MIDRVHRDLTDDDIQQIANTYHAWRGDADCLHEYADLPGFCKAATLDGQNGVRHHNYVLTPGRYVGAAEIEEDGEPFDEKMARLTAELRQQMAEATKLDAQIWANLAAIGYGG